MKDAEYAKTSLDRDLEDYMDVSLFFHLFISFRSFLIFNRRLETIALQQRKTKGLNKRLTRVHWSLFLNQVQSGWIRTQMALQSLVRVYQLAFANALHPRPGDNYLVDKGLTSCWATMILWWHH
jgi:hypothetical protein